MANNVPREERQLIFAVLEHLQSRLATVSAGGDTGLDAESLEVACQCLSAAYALDPADETQQKDLSIAPLSLVQVFSLGLAGKEQISSAIDALKQQQPAQQAQAAQPQQSGGKSEPADPEFEAKWQKYLKSITDRGYFENYEEGTDAYNVRLEKARQKLKESMAKGKKIDQAEKLKQEGNAKLSAQQYGDAISLYTQAIELNSSNAIYFANRAAAYTHMNEFQKAVSDAKTAVEKDPNYSRAYSRLGLAHFHLEQYNDAVRAYEKAVELDPANPGYKEALEMASAKLGSTPKSTTETSSSSSSSSAAGGLGSNSNFGATISSMMQNEAFMNQVKGFANANANGNANENAEQPAAPGALPGGFGGGMPPNIPPGMAGLLNPQMMQMAQGMMQQPQFQQMLQDPAIMGMAQQMMQNPGALNDMLSSVGGMEGLMQQMGRGGGMPGGASGEESEK